MTGNVIIIGSSGFLGSEVTRELIAGGYNVYATKNKRPIHQVPGLTVIEGGIKSLTAGKLNEIGPEAIFHCARPVLPGFRRWGRVIAALQAKRFNRFLLRQIVASRDKPALIFASGSLVYGNSNFPHNEDAPLNPISYARQYHRGESPVSEAVHEDKTKVLILRFPWLLGNGSWFSWFYLKPLQEKKLVPLFGEGSNMMSVVSLSDAARIMVGLYKSGTGSGIYNIRSPFILTQRSFAALVASHFAGRVTDYMDIFPSGVEKAVTEAFESNIVLASSRPELLKNYPFQRMDQILDEIKTL